MARNAPQCELTSLKALRNPGCGCHKFLGHLKKTNRKSAVAELPKSNNRSPELGQDCTQDGRHKKALDMQKKKMEHRASSSL